MGSKKKLTPFHLVVMKEKSSGAALLLVVSAITIMTIIMAEFTYETQLNKIRSYRLVDKIQAKLNADAGVNLALAYLRNYQVYRNLIEKNASIKSVFPTSALEDVIIGSAGLPKLFPPPSDLPGMGPVLKSAIDDFLKELIIKGNFNVEITAENKFLNPNLLVVLSTTSTTSQQGQSNSGFATTSQQNTNGQTQKSFKSQFIDLIDKKLTQEQETNEDYDILYGSLKAEDLVEELIYYVNDRSRIPEEIQSEFDATYSDANVKAKHAPLENIEEMYQLVGWSDAIVNLILPQISVDSSQVIPVNELTKDQMGFLFPEASEVQLQDFFDYRDGSEERELDPNPFETIESFTKYTTSEASLSSKEDLDKKLKQLEDFGIKLGTANQMYKVTSTGSYNDNQYKIVATIVLPTKEPDPPPWPKDLPKTFKVKTDDEYSQLTDTQQKEYDKHLPIYKKWEEDKKKTPSELLPPRVINLRVE